MDDTIWMAIVVSFGIVICIGLELLRERRIMKLRWKVLKQKEMKKKLLAKHSKRLYKQNKKDKC